MKIGVDYIGVGVGTVIFNEENKVFLAKRGLEVRNEKGKWEFPGGGLEFGEDMKLAIIREIEEEYGFEIEIVELLDVVNHIIPKEKQHWVSPTFIAKYKSGEPKIMEPHKCDDIGWFTYDEVEKMDLSLITIEDLKNLKEKYPNGLR